MFYRAAPIGGRAPDGAQFRELPWASYDLHLEVALTPARLVDAWRAAEQGDLTLQCDLITGLIEGDATLRDLFARRRGDVSNKPRAWQADGSEGDSEVAARVLDRAMRELPLTAALDHQLTFNAYGFAATEIIWGLRLYEGREWVVPVDLINVPHKRFYCDPRTQELRLLTEKNAATGEALVPGKWWITVSPGCSIARGGLGRTAGPYAMYKRWATRDWVIYSERYGLPIIIVKIPHNAVDELKTAAQTIVGSIGKDGGAVVEVPEDRTVDLEVHEVSKASSDHTSGSLITHCNREMAKLINGSTLTNDNADSGGASYALGQVHESTRWEAIVEDAGWIQASQHAAIAKPFIAWNQFAVETRPPCLEIQIVRDLGPAALLAAAKDAIAMGWDVSISQLRRATGLRAPVGAGDSVFALIAERQAAARAAQPREPQQESAEPPT